MKKKLLLCLAVGLGINLATHAQIPSYVPTNGLVGWWPFNGNANDESGNGNNGSFTGLSCIGCATITAPPSSTTDRLNNSNSAYQFTNNLDLISIANSNSLQVTQTFSISFWANPNLGTYGQGPSYLSILQKWGGTGTGASYIVHLNTNGKPVLTTNNGVTNTALVGDAAINLNEWSHVLFTFDNGLAKLFINGLFINSSNSLNAPAIQSSSIEIGRNLNQFSNSTSDSYTGKLDDIGIWNRALTQQEITTLYQSCALNPVVSNQTASLGQVVQFSATSSANTSYQWQTNPNHCGWQNVPVNSTYTGSTSNTLTLNVAEHGNHNQPFRVIATSGNCVDTSDVALLNLADTCITTINDTVTTYISVTDTLIINTSLGLNQQQSNTIKIYPNPAKDQLIIDNGDYVSMAGYTLNITTNSGQQVFSSAISQAQFIVDLSTWNGNGLYFVHLLDAQGNTVTIRKIILE